MAYATIGDLASRWRPMSPAEEERAEALLDDAAVLLGKYSDADADLLRIVSCNMVRRAMLTSGDAFGIDGQTVDTELWAPDLPTGELKLLKKDIALLRGTRIGSIAMELM